MSGLIGKKVGMTSIFDENGKNIPCTIIEAGPCVVTQVRTKEVDGMKLFSLVSMTKRRNILQKQQLGTLPKRALLLKRNLSSSKALRALTN